MVKDFGDKATEKEFPDSSPWISRRQAWIFAGAVALLLGLLAWWLGPTAVELLDRAVAFLGDEANLEAFVAWMGWLGPPALVLLNALQIVVAPIPGYAVFAVAGVLYGPFWGGVIGSLGMLLGATLAMWLSRRYGRPLVARLVGEERLRRWDETPLSHSTVLWALLLLGLVGDIPYFLAGLARVSYVKILLLTIVTRVPMAFLVAAAAAGSTSLDWPQLALIIGVLLAVFGLAVRFQEPILAWIDRRIHGVLGQEQASEAGNERSARAAPIPRGERNGAESG